MSAPPIHIAATKKEGSVIPVEWRIGFTKPKGVVRVEIPADVPQKHEAAIAELTAIRYLVDSRQVGTSMRPHQVMVTQQSIKELLDQTAASSSLIPYGRHLYLYVNKAKLGVEDADWAKGIELDPERITNTKAIKATWPGGPCPVLGVDVGISRHAVDRFIQRCGVRGDYWHAFQSILKAMQAKTMRIVPPEEIARTNPGMRRNSRTYVLHHQAVDNAFIVVQEDEGWVLVTVHAHYQEFVPTFKGGRVEYRRNS